MLRLFTLFTFTTLSSILFAQSPIGIWKNLDDTDGKEKSHIEIYESNGKLRGKVVKLLPAATITRCDKCEGANYSCKIEADGPSKLNVRGFLGLALFGRTQVWYRVK